MIVRFFKAGISNGESPVRYLLSHCDHAGTEREVPPEVLEGSPTGNTTIQIINGISRRWKYVSGVIAFRQEEQPTREQLYQVIDRFKAVAAPLDPEHFHSFWVLHKDKGNTELHFVFPMVLLSGTDKQGRDLTGKAFNIRPPGTRSEELFDRFQQVMNHELGYAQIVADPLAVRLAHFWHKPAGQVPKRKVDTLQRTLLKGIGRGKIGNRSELCEYLQEQLGLTLTRQGENFISVKFPGDKKAIRLKGPLFEASANYARLLSERESRQEQSALTENQYRQVLGHLNQLVQERADFIQGNLPARTRTTTTRRKNDQSSNGRRHRATERNAQLSEPTHSPARAAGRTTTTGSGVRAQHHQGIQRPTEQTQGRNQGLVDSPGRHAGGRREGTGRRGIAAAFEKLGQEIKQGGLGGSGGAIALSLAGLQVEIDAAQADLANGQTLEIRIRAERRLQGLMAQRDRLLADLEDAKRVEMNHRPLCSPKLSVR